MQGEAKSPRDSGGEVTLSECLVWTAAERPPQELIESLGRRSVRAEVRHEALAVMAGACVIARRARGRGFVVVLVEPTGLRGSGDVFRALARCVPDARCWQYVATEEGSELRAATATDAAQWPSLGEQSGTFTGYAGPEGAGEKAGTRAGTPDPLKVNVRPRGTPKLRLTEPAEERSARGGDDGAPGPQMTPDMNPGKLSDDELAMLLREGNFDGAEGPDGGTRGNDEDDGGAT